MILKKILFSHYSLAVFFSKGKKEVVDNGTCYLFSNNLLFFIVAILMLLLSKIAYKLSPVVLITALFFLLYVCFYAIKKYLLNLIYEGEFLKIHKAISKKEKRNSIALGLLMFIGSYIFFTIVSICVFQGYLN